MQRLANSLLYAVQDDSFAGRFWKYVLDLDVDVLYRMINSTALILLNSHFVTHSPQAWAPNTIDIGGLHCKEGKPLPEDLQLFLDSHPEGVVYVSFGSSVK